MVSLIKNVLIAKAFAIIFYFLSTKLTDGVELPF